MPDATGAIRGGGAESKSFTGLGNSGLMKRVKANGAIEVQSLAIMANRRQPHSLMKSLHTNLLLTLSLFVAAITGCTPQTPEAKIDGVWRYEAPVATDNVFGGGRVVTERIDMKLSPDGKVNLTWEHGGDNAMGPIDGTWKHQGDVLVMTRPDTSFGVFKIIAVEPAELRVLSRSGKLYRLTRMPNG